MNNLPYLEVCKGCKIKEYCGSILTGPPICALKSLEVQPNSLQQLKAEILRICDEAEEQYNLKGMSEASTYFGAIRAKLSAV